MLAACTGGKCVDGASNGADGSGKHGGDGRKVTQMRILVFGPPKSGKSTLGQELRGLNADVHIDETEYVDAGICAKYDLRIYVGIDAPTSVYRMLANGMTMDTLRDTSREIANRHEELEHMRTYADVAVYGHSPFPMGLFRSYLEPSSHDSA